MTAQFAEKLLLEGKCLSLCTNPLSSYFALAGNFLEFESNNTALWRGYVGTWEILYDRLYLIELRGTLTDGKAVSLEQIFPGYPDRVFAHWYSGDLRIPQGKLVEYKHMGYGSLYEQDLLISIDRGVIKKKWVQQNQQAPENAVGDGYGIGAVTIFPRSNHREESGL